MKQAQINQLLWHSRRGLRELDMLLVPFAKDQLNQLSHTDQCCYERLLDHEDQDLLAWFLEREQPDNPDLVVMIQNILHHSRAYASGTCPVS